MTKQAEALRLAHWLERDGANCVAHTDAAAELRRLHEVNAELLAALKDASEYLDYVGYVDSWERECAHDSRLPERIEAAINKATGETE